MSEENGLWPIQELANDLYREAADGDLVARVLIEGCGSTGATHWNEGAEEYLRLKRRLKYLLEARREPLPTEATP